MSPSWELTKPPQQKTINTCNNCAQTTISTLYKLIQVWMALRCVRHFRTISPLKPLYILLYICPLRQCTRCEAVPPLQTVNSIATSAWKKRPKQECPGADWLACSCIVLYLSCISVCFPERIWHFLVCLVCILIQFLPCLWDCLVLSYNFQGNSNSPSIFHYIGLCPSYTYIISYY